MKIPGEMLKLAEHIVETKSDDFDPDEFVDHYETAVVELLKQKQSGKAVSKTARRSSAKQVGNVIDLLKKSLELSKKQGKDEGADASAGDAENQEESASLSLELLGTIKPHL